MEKNQINAQQGYDTYQGMVNKTSQSISDLSKICDKLGLHQQKLGLSAAVDKLHKKTFNVGIIGSFRKGKSTLINALLGQEIVPSDIVPTSATLNYIRYDTIPSAEIRFKDGTIKNIPIGEINNYITKITKESAAVAATVDKSIISYPCKFCQNSVQIIDTPGLEDTAEMDKITESVIPYLDAMILVVVPGHPFGGAEADFVRNKVMTSDLGRILVVVNKIDTLESDDDRRRIIALIKDRFQESVLEKLGENVNINDAQSKVGNLHIIGVSARNALKGKQNGDNNKFEESNFQELENSLSWILNEERGILELISPVNLILSTAKEIQSVIDMRLNAISMDAQKLDELTNKGIAEAERSREIAEKEIKKLSNGAKNLQSELLPEVVKIYSSLEEDMMKYVSDVEINPSDISDEDGIKEKSDEMLKKIKSELQQKLSASTERLTVKIQEKINDEVSTFNKKAEKIFSGIIDVQADFSSTGSKDKSFNWGVAAVDALTNISSIFGLGIFGIGGIISGFRENGFTGAVVGGVAGFATGYAASCAVAAAGASIIGMPIIIPALAVGGIVSTFGGKFAVNKIFSRSIGEQNVAKVRSLLQSNVTDTMKGVRETMVLENWLSNACGEAYKYLTDRLTIETQNVLTDFEHTMRQISLDKQKQQSEIDATRANLEEMRKRLSEVAEIIAPVKQKLAGSLNGGAV